MFIRQTIFSSEVRLKHQCKYSKCGENILMWPNVFFFQNDIHGVDYWTLLAIQHAVGKPLPQNCQETEEVSTEESSQGKWTGG